MGRSVNYFSVDIDWAPEEVVADTLSLFEQYRVKCTLFATHESDVLSACDRELFEVGIHPNFNPLLNGESERSAAAVLDEILALYPEATGVRSHSMTQSTALLHLFSEKGLAYDANHFLPYWPNIEPYRLWNGMVKIPYNWEDDIHFMYGRDYAELGIDLDRDALSVFDFHPIHVFLNTENAARYERARAAYHDASELEQYVNRESYGARDALIHLLEHVNSAGHGSAFLRDLANECE
jgi:hypothetical protein